MGGRTCERRRVEGLKKAERIRSNSRREGGRAGGEGEREGDGDR